MDFASFEDTDKERETHLKSDNIEIMIYDKADGVAEERFLSLLNRNQIGLETSMRISDFIFHCVNLLRYKSHKINLKHGGSHIDSPDWIQNEKATLHHISDDDKCF